MTCEAEENLITIISDIQDIESQMFKILRGPVCLHPTVTAKLKETRRVLFEAHWEAIRIKEGY